MCGAVRRVETGTGRGVAKPAAAGAVKSNGRPARALTNTRASAHLLHGIKCGEKMHNL